MNHMILWSRFSEQLIRPGTACPTLNGGLHSHAPFVPIHIVGCDCAQCGNVYVYTYMCKHRKHYSPMPVPGAFRYRPYLSRCCRQFGRRRLARTPSPPLDNTSSESMRRVLKHTTNKHTPMCCIHVHQQPPVFKVGGEFGQNSGRRSNGYKSEPLTPITIYQRSGCVGNYHVTCSQVCRLLWI